ncbi:MAG: AgmX/PglI C-terminal domain-containing protein [Myxococcota bacterium]|nr:AgmX/PglI C-terminal domain-containing protein [Myxococcota bacterium]
MMKNIVIAAACALVLTLTSGCLKVNPNTQGHIQTALEAKQGEFKKCYEDALQRDREIQGNIDLVLQIDKDNGKVIEAQVEKTKIADMEMKQCVAGAAETIALPEPPGVPIEGHYAVEFSFE